MDVYLIPISKRAKMDVTQIPFAKYIGIEKKEEGILKLEPTDIVQNHIQTIHASAQFALAETQSGLYLQDLFPTYVGKVLPLLRSASVKFKHPAQCSITAEANVPDIEKEKFLALFEKKGRASILVTVELIDEKGVVTMTGEYHWFIQKI